MLEFRQVNLITRKKIFGLVKVLRNRISQCILKRSKFCTAQQVTLSDFRTDLKGGIHKKISTRIILL